MVLALALLVGVVVAAHMVPFPFLFEAFRPSGSIWHVKAARGAPPTLYFTFDDGPNAAWTPPLLDALRDTGIRATFFLIDEHITARDRADRPPAWRTRGMPSVSTAGPAG